MEVQTPSGYFCVPHVLVALSFSSHDRPRNYFRRAGSADLDGNTLQVHFLRRDRQVHIEWLPGKDLSQVGNDQSFACFKLTRQAWCALIGVIVRLRPEGSCSLDLSPWSGALRVFRTECKQKTLSGRRASRAPLLPRVT